MPNFASIGKILPILLAVFSPFRAPNVILDLHFQYPKCSHQAPKTMRITIGLFVFIALSGQLLAGHPYEFPWSTNCASASQTPHQILSAQPKSSKAPVAIQSLPPKPTYAYGWFGSNPTAQPRRQFGYHQNYTQWSFK